jgi:hypothetical protein
LAELRRGREIQDIRYFMNPFLSDLSYCKGEAFSRGELFEIILKSVAIILFFLLAVVLPAAPDYPNPDLAARRPCHGCR